MTLGVSNLQSDSDLDSIRKSCDVYLLIHSQKMTQKCDARNIYSEVTIRILLIVQQCANKDISTTTITICASSVRTWFCNLIFNAAIIYCPQSRASSQHLKERQRNIKAVIQSYASSLLQMQFCNLIFIADQMLTPLTRKELTNL